MGTTGDPTDYFGMDLLYDQVDTGVGNTAWFNGNIGATKWSSNRGFSTEKAHAYAYGYDPLNRLTLASYKKNIAGAWTSSSSFTESGYSYDLNGNILGLTRNGDGGAVIDALTYDYGTGTTRSNQLLKVADTGDITKGFLDGANTGSDYTYDINGNMVSDQNKALTAANAIQYNHLNLPKVVTKNTAEYINYIYDATGRKLRQEVYNASNALQKGTDYSGEYVYENSVLQFINTDEGRVVMTGANPEYQFHMKDHLGNVRTTYSTVAAVEANTATLETANQATELSKFLRYSNAELVYSTLLDHTNGSSPGYAERLNGSANEKYGVARSLSVMAGDTLRIEVYAKYIDPTTSNWTAALSTLMSQIAAPTAGVVVDGAAIASSTSSFPVGYPGLVSKSDNGAPKAYLNWLIFDKNFGFITGGFKQISTAAKEAGTDVAHERIAPPSDIAITQAGYAYIYLSNESASVTEVYFDDLKVTQVKSPIIQSDDYYPFGLRFNSYTRDNTLINNKKLFQGQEHIDDLGLNWDSFKWRNHQPDIGRFFNVDPLSEKYFYNSPYAFSENKVVAHVELEGLESVEINATKKSVEVKVDIGKDPIPPVAVKVEDGKLGQGGDSPKSGVDSKVGKSVMESIQKGQESVAKPKTESSNSKLDTKLVEKRDASVAKDNSVAKVLGGTLKEIEKTKNMSKESDQAKFGPKTN